MKSELPQLKDFCEYEILYPDEKKAVDHFLGKSLDDAKNLFSENDLYYADDLRWMGEKAFQYYLPAFIDFIMSDNVNISSDSLNNLVSLLRSKIENEMSTIKACKLFLLESLVYCVQNYSKFEVDTKIYGDLKRELLDIMKIIKSLE